MQVLLHGDEKETQINFPNGMKAIITYGDDENPFGKNYKYACKLRKTELYDENGEFMVETIETNPHYSKQIYKGLNEEYIKAEKLFGEK